MYIYEASMKEKEAKKMNRGIAIEIKHPERIIPGFTLPQSWVYLSSFDSSFKPYFEGDENG